MVEVVDEVACTAHVSSEGADRLRQCAHLDVDAPVLVEVVDRATAVAA